MTTDTTLRPVTAGAINHEWMPTLTGHGGLNDAPSVTLPVMVVSLYIGKFDSAPGWPDTARAGVHRYAVTVASLANGHSLFTPYTEGAAHVAGRATTSDIMASLLTDAQSVMPYLKPTEVGIGSTRLVPDYYNAARDWASDNGYHHGDREARQIWRACVKTANRLRDMLGDDVFAQAREIAGEL